MIIRGFGGLLNISNKNKNKKQKQKVYCVAHKNTINKKIEMKQILFLLSSIWNQI